MNLLNSTYGPLVLLGGNRSYHAIMRLLLILLWVACFCLSLSQTTPGGGGGGGGGGTNQNPAEGDYDGYTEIELGPWIGSTPFARVKVNVATPGVNSPEDFINGTDTAVACSALVAPDPYWGDLNQDELGRPLHNVVIAGYTLMNAEITVAGQSIENHSWNLDGECSHGHLNGPPSFTFASTHFSHGTQVEIRLQAQFQAYKMEGEVRVPVGSLMTHYARLKPTVHNKLVGWRTHVTVDGGAWTSSMDQNINDTVNTLKSMYESANYDVTHVDLGIVQEPVLESRYETASAIATNTHGKPGGLFDSDGWTGANSLLTWLEQKNALNAEGVRGEDDELPRTHLNVLYACSAMQSSTAAAYGLQPLIEGGVVCGFENPLAVLCVDTDTGDLVSLALHAGEFKQALLNGKSVLNALEDAHLKFMPRDLNGNLMSMAFQGDPNSTLKWVYLTGQDRILHESFQDWKVIRWGGGIPE